MVNREYRIATLPAGTVAADVNWNEIPVAPIDHFFWYEGHTPATHAQMVYVEDFGFILRMTCAEEYPKAVYHNYNEPV